MTDECILSAKRTHSHNPLKRDKRTSHPLNLPQTPPNATTIAKNSTRIPHPPPLSTSASSASPRPPPHQASYTHNTNP